MPPVWESYIHQIVNSSSISFFFWNSWFLPLPLRMVPLPLFHSFLVFPFWKNLKKIWHTPGSVNFDFLFVLIISIKCLLLFCHYFWDIWCSLSGASLSQRVSASSLRDSRFFRCGHLKNKALTIILYCSGVGNYKKYKIVWENFLAWFVCLKESTCETRNFIFRFKSFFHFWDN